MVGLHRERGFALPLLSSGKMAAANRVSEKALRIYQEKGILIPAYINEATGRRYYDIQQSTKLDMILQLQQIGFSLDEIAEVNEEQSISLVLQRAQEHLDDLRDQLYAITLKCTSAECLIESCERYLKPPLIGHIMLEKLPERPIIVFRNHNSEKLRADSGLDNAEQWEWTRRNIRQKLVDEEIPLSTFHNLSVLIPRKTLEEGAPTKKFTFVYADELSATLPDSRRSILAGGSYLTMYSETAYDEDGRELDSARLQKMLRFAQEHDFEIAGDAFCEEICRFPRFFSTGPNLLYRLCVPVQSSALALNEYR